ncbi:MAG: toll/interleukin-1 receptor domain-containing protein, partial [Denitromonas halophila]
MAQKTLSKEAVSRARSRLEPELGRVNLLRFDTVVALLDARGQANLGAVIEQLYPDQQRASALSNYRQFRRLLQVGAASAGIKLSLETDGKTRSEPETRTCWFEGDDGAIEAVTRFVKAEVLDAERTGQDVMELVDPEGPPVVRFFVSYAHEDATDVANLLKPLRTLLNVASNYRFEHWMDKAILPGEHWRKEIERALNDCHFGLLFVSPAFLNSAYISEHELPQFVARDNDDSGVRKYALPVALHRFPLDGSINLKGLEQHQIFLDAKGRTFEERSTDKTRRDFAQELFARLVKAVGKQLAVASKPPEAKARSGRDRQEGALESHLRAAVADGEDPACFVRTRGLVGSLDKLDEDTETTQEAPRADAIEYLGKWINDPDAPPYCALLGEVGMGKTTTCRAFAGYLLQQREHNPAIALPIYLDLRLLGERAKSEPVLSDILTQVLARSWKGGHVDHAVQAQELIRLVQEEGALVIFDGLDEVLVHLTPAQGQHFARELFRILPPANKRQAKSDAIRRGRLLISCRTHYFRTLRDQKTFLTAEGRDGIRHEDYRALVLLPFNEDQILSYLTETLPDEDPERVMEVIRSVHNLSEIAERPYTLSLIAKHFHQIERWNLEGRKVTGLMLYRHMVLSWLERDTGKHQLTPDHKQALMEYFAAALWRSGKRLWRV